MIKKNKKTPTKPKTFKKGIKKLTIFCKPHYPAIIISFLLASVGAVLTVLGPNRIGDLSDEILNGMFTTMDFKAITSIALSLVLIYSLSIVFTYIQGLIMASVTQKVTKKLRTKLSSKINNVPLKYIDGKTHGDILSRVTNDVEHIGQTLNDSVASLIAGVVLLIGSIVMMFVTNWTLALCAIGSTLLGFGLMSIMMIKSQKYFNQHQDNLGKLNGHIEEFYTGHSVVKISNAEKQGKAKFEKINTRLKKDGFKSQFYSGLMMPLMTFVGNLGYVVVCVVGAVLVNNNSINLGVIVSFMIYIRLFMQPLGTIAQGMTSLQSTAACSERVFEFLEEKEMEKEENMQVLNMEDVKGDVVFENVSFSYVKGKKIINNFSTKVKSGQKIAIVGPTGGGKTTIVNLLMKFYDIDEGDIIIDGRSIHDLSRENIHDLFSMVLQDTWIFNGTVMENIIYSKKNITIEEVEKVCKEIGIHHFIMTLPEGYNTMLSEKASLSQGQKQLLTIARAMIQNSPMLILDEATSSVDTRTEKQIQEAMDNLTKDRTSFVIAHRLSTIKNADLILVLKDGNIEEQGSHKQLLEKQGFYHELYNSQFANEEG